MKHALVSAACLLALTTPALAKDYLVRAEPRDDSGLVGGTADLVLEGTPRLVLRVDGKPEETLRGARVAGGYLFSPDADALDRALSVAAVASDEPTTSGLIGGIQREGGPVREAEVLVGGLRLRAEPSTDAAVVDAVRGGMRLVVSEERDGWVKVRGVKGREGWGKIGAPPNAYLSVSQVIRLESVPNARSIFLRPNVESFEGQERDGEQFGGRLFLRRPPQAAKSQKRVLAMPDKHHSGDGGAFNAYANEIKREYEAHGYEVEIANIDCWEDVIDQLNSAAGAPYSRVVFIGHGGWDGPILHAFVGTRQISGKYHEELWGKFIAALSAGTTPDAKLYASSCHSAGTAQGEDASWASPYRWVHDIAHRTGRTAAGPAGKTSTEYTLRQTLASLEGVGTVGQEVHVARGDQLRILRPGMSLASAQTVPLPPIEGLTKDPETPIGGNTTEAVTLTQPISPLPRQPLVIAPFVSRPLGQE